MSRGGEFPPDIVVYAVLELDGVRAAALGIDFGGCSAMVPLSSCHLVQRFSVMTLREALVWGSNRRADALSDVRGPGRRRVLTAQVVLPTPPFMLMNETTCAFAMRDL